jgi:hypothetical protein
MKQSKMNLEKIKLHAILHNVRRWQDVMSCTSCDFDQTCKKKYKSFTKFYCLPKDLPAGHAGDVDHQSFSLEEGHGPSWLTYIFFVCKHWKQR